MFHDRLLGEIRFLFWKTCVRKVLEVASDDLSVKVTSIRKSFTGFQKANFRLKCLDAKKLVYIACIKIGWVNVRIKTKIKALKSFRCLENSHI